LGNKLSRMTLQRWA